MPEKNAGNIRNKMKRQDIYHKLKQQANRDKLKRRMLVKKQEEKEPALKAKRLAENVPETQETMKEIDETMVGGDAEVLKEQETDEFADYFVQGQVPKILVTTSKRASAVLFY